jgi:hypothetical protein
MHVYGGDTAQVLTGSLIYTEASYDGHSRAVISRYALACSSIEICFVCSSLNKELILISYLAEPMTPSPDQ